MSNYYKLRVDLHTVQIDNILTLVNKYSTTYAYCVEGTTTNPHAHFYLATSTKKEAIRVELRKLALRGNRDYSFSTLDEQYPIEYLGYLMKEGNFHSVGIPDEIICSARLHMERIQSEQKTKRRKTHVDRIIDLIEPADRRTIDEDGLRTIQSLELVSTYILRYHLDNDLLLRKTQVLTYLINIVARLDPRAAGIHMGDWIRSEFRFTN